MMMENEKYILLIYQKIKSGLSPQEEAQLEQWLSKSPENKEIQEHITQSWELMDDLEPDFEVDAEADFEQFLRPQIQPSVEQKQAKTVPMPRRNGWWQVAAAALVLIGGLYLVNLYLNPPVEMLVAQTAANETKTVKLADGSQVWLNENSVLSYPDRFVAAERNVQLSGEAYFEVQARPEQVFKIEMDQTNITVLGTSFNVKARKEDQAVDVSVQSGKVRFATKDESTSVILEKNESASYEHKTRKITPNKGLSLNALSWKTQELSFRNTPMSEVFSVLEAFFEVEIIMEESPLGNCPYTMPKRKADLDDILDTFIKLFKVEIVKNEVNQYVVKGGDC